MLQESSSFLRQVKNAVLQNAPECSRMEGHGTHGCYQQSNTDELRHPLMNAHRVCPCIANIGFLFLEIFGVMIEAQFRLPYVQKKYVTQGSEVWLKQGIQMWQVRT